MVQTPKQVSGFLASLNRYQLIDRAVVTSFKADELAKIRQGAKPLGTTLRLMFFVGITKVSAADLTSAGLTFVAVDMRIVTKAYLATLHAAGVKTVAYLADSEDQWRAARPAGADYVVTDVPGAYLKWAGSR